MGNSLSCTSNFDCLNAGPEPYFCGYAVAAAAVPGGPSTPGFNSFFEEFTTCLTCAGAPHTQTGAIMCDFDYETYFDLVGFGGDASGFSVPEDHVENCLAVCPNQGCRSDDDCDGENEFCNFYFGVPGYCEVCTDGDCDKGGGAACFPPDATAVVEGKGRQPMKNIRVGDRVLTGDGRYSSVYVVDHRHATKPTPYLQIHTSAVGNDENENENENPLEITSSHMLFVEGQHNPIPASLLQVGDALKTLRGYHNVTGINKVVRDGVYNPITADGTIVVDGFVASTYNAFSANDAQVVIGGWKTPISHQTFLHYALTPLRALCLGVSSSFCEIKDDVELHPYSMLGTTIWKHTRDQNAATQGMVLASPIIVILAIISALIYKRCGGKQQKKRV